ncbi:MAG TPA: MoxR family ATPase [Gammaproteobacteria bacterium]|nr:MoxR family ATPase [Gammaproteobacteria bacterium]
MNSAKSLADRLKSNLNAVIFGMDEAIHGICLALIARGHILLEGVPGLGKTLLAKTLARQLDGDFKRIQCTSDMMPSDLTGIHVFNAAQGSFELLRGPLFAKVVLVDEINRTGPKTQSALLQAMEEGRITLDRATYPLQEDFLVIASQNPYEYEGTFPLLESQLDRFLLKLTVGYPASDIEKKILRNYAHPGGGHDEEAKADLLDPALVAQARAEARAVHVADVIYDYVTAIAQASRAHAALSLGLSSRGALALMRCAKAQAALRASEFVTPDDVKNVAQATIAHRLILTPEAVLDGRRSEDVLSDILAQIEVPRHAVADAG